MFIFPLLLTNLIFTLSPSEIYDDIRSICNIDPDNDGSYITTALSTGAISIDQKTSQKLCLSPTCRLQIIHAYENHLEEFSKDSWLLYRSLRALYNGLNICALNSPEEAYGLVSFEVDLSNIVANSDLSIRRAGRALSMGLSSVVFENRVDPSNIRIDVVSDVLGQDVPLGEIECPSGFSNQRLNGENLCLPADTNNPCLPNPCDNGGICHKLSLEKSTHFPQFECQCKDFYIGQFCEDYSKLTLENLRISDASTGVLIVDVVSKEHGLKDLLKLNIIDGNIEVHFPGEEATVLTVSASSTLKSSNDNNNNIIGQIEINTFIPNIDQKGELFYLNFISLFDNIITPLDKFISIPKHIDGVFYKKARRLSMERELASAESTTCLKKIAMAKGNDKIQFKVSIKCSSLSSERCLFIVDRISNYLEDTMYNGINEFFKEHCYPYEILSLSKPITEQITTNCPSAFELVKHEDLVNRYCGSNFKLENLADHLIVQKGGVETIDDEVFKPSDICNLMSCKYFMRKLTGIFKGCPKSAPGAAGANSRVSSALHQALQKCNTQHNIGADVIVRKKLNVMGLFNPHNNTELSLSNKLLSKMAAEKLSYYDYSKSPLNFASSNAIPISDPPSPQYKSIEPLLSRPTDFFGEDEQIWSDFDKLEVTSISGDFLDGTTYGYTLILFFNRQIKKCSGSSWYTGSDVIVVKNLKGENIASFSLNNDAFSVISGSSILLEFYADLSPLTVYSIYIHGDAICDLNNEEIKLTATGVQFETTGPKLTGVDFTLLLVCSLDDSCYEARQVLDTIEEEFVLEARRSILGDSSVDNDNSFSFFYTTRQLNTEVSDTPTHEVLAKNKVSPPSTSFPLVLSMVILGGLFAIISLWFVAHSAAPYIAHMTFQYGEYAVNKRSRFLTTIDFLWPLVFVVSSGIAATINTLCVHGPILIGEWIALSSWSASVFISLTLCNVLWGIAVVGIAIWSSPHFVPWFIFDCSALLDSSVAEDGKQLIIAGEVEANSIANNNVNSSTAPNSRVLPRNRLNTPDPVVARFAQIAFIIALFSVFFNLILFLYFTGDLILNVFAEYPSLVSEPSRVGGAFVMSGLICILLSYLGMSLSVWFVSRKLRRPRETVYVRGSSPFFAYDLSSLEITRGYPFESDTVDGAVAEMVLVNSIMKERQLSMNTVIDASSEGNFEDNSSVHTVSNLVRSTSAFHDGRQHGYSNATTVLNRSVNDRQNVTEFNLPPTMTDI